MSARILFVEAVLLAVLATAPGRADEAGPKGREDSEIGLRGVSVFEVAVPPAVRENATDPGAAPLPVRVNDELPPVIPHGVADFLPITRSSNACLDCHEVEAKEPGEPTPVPPSHFRDLRNSPDEIGAAVAGSRWVCVSCHVAPTDAKPLVANPFYAAEAAGHDSDADEQDRDDEESEEKRPPVEP